MARPPGSGDPRDRHLLFGFGGETLMLLGGAMLSEAYATRVPGLFQRRG